VNKVEYKATAQLTKEMMSLVPKRGLLEEEKEEDEK